MKQARKTTIILVDDHPLVREGLKAIISDHPDYIVVGETDTGTDAVRLSHKLKPDLVLLDLGLPDQSGIDVIEKIHAKSAHTKVIVISMHSRAELIVKAFNVGASGYLVKGSSIEKIYNSIKSVMDGDIYMDSSVSNTLLKKVNRSSITSASMQNSTYDKLTPREQEVFILLAEGVSNQEIADKLFIALKTVENHRSNIMGKLGIHSIQELIRFAIKIGLVDPDMWRE